jgi:hypothetical protein
MKGQESRCDRKTGTFEQEAGTIRIDRNNHAAMRTEVHTVVQSALTQFGSVKFIKLKKLNKIFTSIPYRYHILLVPVP